MESAGLSRIIALCQGFNVPNIDMQLKLLQETLDEDERQLRERLDQAILRDLNDPQDVYNAILSKVNGTRARDYFLSMLQHLLLIREDGDSLVHYYQFLDSLVTDVVLDKKLAGAEQRFGHSVERIIAQFNESNRYQNVEDEVAKARAEALRLKLEKEVLEDEVSQGQEGLVGKLKDQLAITEQKLQVSRETTNRLQSQLEAQKAGYEERIAQLEAQIMELFRMLKEVGKGMETIMDNSGGMDRATLISTLEKHIQRDKTKSILEGKMRKKGSPLAADEDENEDEATPRKGGKKNIKRKDEVPGRSSQFMDADEADAEEQIQQQFWAGAKNVSPASISRA